jgi:hypothetical protein
MSTTRIGPSRRHPAFGPHPGLALVPAIPAPAAATDDLLGRVEATWQTLASWRPLVDEGLVATVTAAMEALEEAARLGCGLPTGEQGPSLDELAEIVELAQAIHSHLRGAGAQGDA